MSRRWTLVACILGSGIALIDSTVVNVALPSIQRDLGGGLAAQQWVTNGYLLTLGALILIGGSLGDVLGERRIFATGVAGFGAASLLCAAAPTIGVLIGARALQGVFGALLTPGALAIIVTTFPGRERGAAIGTWTAWTGIAVLIGPVAGGAILTAVSWRWIFAINVPFVLACLALIHVAVPAGEPRGGRRIDAPGAVLAALGLGGPVFALIEEPRLGWGSPGILAPLILGIALLGAFLLRERRAPDPMLPLGLFGERNFRAGNAETFAMYAGLSAMQFFLVLFLQQVAGYSPLESGLATLPITAVMFVLSRRFGRLADRLGPRLFMGAGPLVGAAGLLLLLRLGPDAPYLTELLPAVLVFGLGLSMTVAPLTATVLACVESGSAGIASAVNNAIARVAGLVAIAAIGTAVAAQFSSTLDARLDRARLSPDARAAAARVHRRPLTRPALRDLRPAQAHALRSAATDASLDAFRLGMGIAAALLLAGGALGATRIRNDRAGGQRAERSVPASPSAAASTVAREAMSRRA